jgi:hypothetical protein
MARFLPPEAFHPGEGSLELLPFRFERTEGDATPALRKETQWTMTSKSLNASTIASTRGT